MDDNKEKQEISVLGRLFSMEALIMVMGIASLISGGVTGNVMQVFWGLCIVGGAVVLYFVRKKDWTKHWEEQERIKQAYDERMARERDKGKDNR